MYACVFDLESTTSDALSRLALEFSPNLEKTSSHTVTFSIAPLRALLGTPHQIAEEIARRGKDRNLNINLGIAATPDTAVLLARNFSAITFAPPGQEPEKLGPISLPKLFDHDIPVDLSLLSVMERWGLKTCSDLVSIPQKGIAERRGPAGVYLRNLASGRVNRPLRIAAPTAEYEEQVSLEHPLDTLEPLLFLFARVLSDLCGKLRSQSQAARRLFLKLLLTATLVETEVYKKNINKEFTCQLEFPVPLENSRSILKLLQLQLERHGPPASVIGFVLKIEPADPKRVQGGLFLPPTPAPDKLQITLARIAGMVGPDNVGSPELLNTHRPDAFRMRPSIGSSNRTHLPKRSSSLRLALRLFRPPLYARVKLAGTRPKELIASGVEGQVTEAAGPWRTSGDWWTDTPWARDEWDVQLSDGALYRIYCEANSRNWYVQALYD